jgi:hypothetical protein
VTRVYFNPPAEIAACHSLGDAGKLCLVCLLWAKGDQVDTTRERWEALHADGHDGPKDHAWMPAVESSRIEEAVVMGICDLLPGQLIPVCWSHLAALRRVEQPPGRQDRHLPGYAALPDGLRRPSS